MISQSCDVLAGGCSGGMVSDDLSFGALAVVPEPSAVVLLATFSPLVLPAFCEKR